VSGKLVSTPRKKPKDKSLKKQRGKKLDLDIQSLRNRHHSGQNLLKMNVLPLKKQNEKERSSFIQALLAILIFNVTQYNVLALLMSLIKHIKI
jgi:hypothetical protein